MQQSTGTEISIEEDKFDIFLIIDFFQTSANNPLYVF